MAAEQSRRGIELNRNLALTLTLTLPGILQYASERYLESKLPILYVLTVVGRDEESGELKTRGIFVGDDRACCEF